jgi:chromosomal replication initiation ATPase DnaA
VRGSKNRTIVASQLPLELAPEPSFAAEEFFVSISNETAFTMIDFWPDWPDKFLHLLGPAGCGKSHLGAIWAERSGAKIVQASHLGEVELLELVEGGALLVENAEQIGGAEAQLFHLMNLFRERAASLVLTSRCRPDSWGLATADLLSRLRQAPCVEIGAPDDWLMRAVLVKLLIERQLVVNASVVEYVALHLDRSLDAARSFIDALDREALARRSRITRIMAAEVMERMKGVAAEGGI